MNCWGLVGMLMPFGNKHKILNFVVTPCAFLFALCIVCGIIEFENWVVEIFFCIIAIIIAILELINILFNVFIYKDYSMVDCPVLDILTGKDNTIDEDDTPNDLFETQIREKFKYRRPEDCSKIMIIDYSKDGYKRSLILTFHHVPDFKKKEYFEKELFPKYGNKEVGATTISDIGFTNKYEIVFYNLENHQYKGWEDDSLFDLIEKSKEIML